MMMKTITPNNPAKNYKSWLIYVNNTVYGKKCDSNLDNTVSLLDESINKLETLKNK